AAAPARRRGVGGAHRELLEEVVAEDSSLEDGVRVAVLAVGEDGAITVDRHAVDTPFEAVRVIADAGHAAVRVAGATLAVGVLPLPLDAHRRAELGDEVRLRVVRERRGELARAALLDGA